MSLGLFALNTTATLLLGMLIGVERQWRQYTAGLRLKASVALGAALFVGLDWLDAILVVHKPAGIPHYFATS